MLYQMWRVSEVLSQCSGGKGVLACFAFSRGNYRVTLIPGTSGLPLPSDTPHEFGPGC